jgi:crotonobetainyl-CoA:carnitine CoA-transferase CaiB-like acyl-CoA transferase
MSALEGIRVVEVGLLVQGPQAAGLLCDMGASVIKVELPGFGDQARWVPASPTDPRSGYFLACNRGKRSITVDLHKPDGIEVFLRLVDTADVLISNFKPNTLDEWGVGYDVLSQRNPGLIYATGSAFGSIGPDALLEGADLAGQASGGLIATTGRDGGEPTPVGVTIADHMASQHLAAGILGALIARGRTGKGQRVDVSLLGGAIWAQASEITSYSLSGQVPGRANRSHPLINGGYGILKTSDGHIALVGVPPQHRAAFAAAIGKTDLWESDPRFASPWLTPEGKQALLDVLETIFATKTTAEWCEILRPCTRFAPVRGYPEIVADPQVYENGYLFKADHPTYGSMTLVGTPIRMSDTPIEVAIVAPELGEHTEEILLELGYEWEHIAALRENASI